MKATKKGKRETKEELLNKIFTNEKLSQKDKILDFTRNYCVQELAATQDLKDEQRDNIPYICLFSGLSLLQQANQQDLLQFKG